MRRSSIFWGSIIILLGVVLLVGQFMPGFNIWGIFWPLVLILLGIWFLVGRRLAGGAGRLVSEQVAVPLAETRVARIRLHHGAGRLEVNSAAAPGMLLSGSFLGGVEQNLERSGDAARLDLRTPGDVFFGGWPFATASEGLQWTIGLSREVEVQLELETGASETHLDLQDLRVSELTIKTGASSSSVTLPANAGLSRVAVQSGAASVELFVPQGVAARIHVQSGLAGIQIDPARFPANPFGYQSPNFESAANKVDIAIETGVGSVTVR